MNDLNEPRKDIEPDSGQEQEPAQEEHSQEDFEQVKGIAALAYLIFFLPLLIKPQSKFGKFHANQGLLLLLTSLAISLASAFLSFIIPLLSSYVITPLGVVFCVLLFIMGVINAINGKMVRLPVIGQYDIIK